MRDGQTIGCRIDMSKFKSVLFFVFILYTLYSILYTSSAHAAWTTDLTPPVVTITPSPSLLLSFWVKPYLVYPADKPMYPEYETAVRNYMVELQDWYKRKVGITFFMQPLIVVRSTYNYDIIRCDPNPTDSIPPFSECLNDPKSLAGNLPLYMNLAIHGVERWEEKTVALVFSAGGGGYAGGSRLVNDTGYAVTGDWVLEPISGKENGWGIPCRYSDGWQCAGGVPKGSPAHELGHAFGLLHPDPTLYPEDSIMKFHGGYPTVGFLPHEVDLLKQSPFFTKSVCNTSVNPITCPANTSVTINITCADGTGSSCQSLTQTGLSNQTGSVSSGITGAPVTGSGPADNKTITANGLDNAGNNGASQSLDIIFLPPPPTVTLSASPTSIISGNSTTLTWNISGNATSCTVSNSGTPTITQGSWDGTLSAPDDIANGLHTRSITMTSTSSANKTFNISCSNTGGSSLTASTTVTVNPPPNCTSSTGSLVCDPSCTLNANSTNTCSNNGTKSCRYEGSSCTTAPAPPQSCDVPNCSTSQGYTCVNGVCTLPDCTGTPTCTCNVPVNSCGTGTRTCTTTGTNCRPITTSSSCTGTCTPGNICDTGTGACNPILSASCSVTPISATVSQNVTWSATRSGGTGTYSYSWSGTDSLSGTTQSITKAYSTTGNKTGQVNVASGSQTTGNVQCSNSVTVCDTAVACPDTCHTDSITVADGANADGTCKTKTCSPNNTSPSYAIQDPPACRTTDGSVPDGQCGSTTYTSNCSTSCSNDACVPTITLNTPTAGTTSCQGASPRISLSWTATEAQNYEVFRNDTSIGNIIQTIYNDNNLSNNTSYSYYVEAINGPNRTRSNTIIITSSECRPDLICQNPAISGTLNAGGTLTLSATIKNQGASEAGTSTTQFKIGTDVIGNITTDTLLQNATEAKSTTWTATAGSHTLTVSADSAGTVSEADENNNSCPTTSTTFTVNAPPTCSAININNPTDPVYTGQSRTFTATAADSDGTIASYSWSTSGGTPTSSTTSSLNWTSSTTGSYDIRLTVTDNNGATATCPVRTVTTNWPPLTTSCSANPTTVQGNADVTWTAAATGGNGNYTSYTWAGNAPLAGKTGSPVVVNYNSVGDKTGSVTVRDSIGNQGSNDCSTTVRVDYPPPPQPNFVAGSPTTACGGVDAPYVDVSWQVSEPEWVQSYTIQRFVGGSTIAERTVTDLTATTYRDNIGLLGGTSYSYRIFAVNTTSQTYTDSAVITPNCARPTASLFVNSGGAITNHESATIEASTEATLTWTSTNADECVGGTAPPTPYTGPWIGVKTSVNNPSPGEKTGRLAYPVNPPYAYIFNITCTNTNLDASIPERQATDAVQVDVKPPLPPFIQTTGGDVHTQQQINTPGGP